jgi:hypothetical protein
MGWNRTDNRDPFRQGDEVAAAAALSKKAAGARLWIALPIVSLGVLVSVAGLLVIAEAWTESEPDRVPHSVVAGVFLAPLLGAGFLARAISRVVLRRLGRAWAEEIAQRYGVSRAVLEDITRYWD